MITDNTRTHQEVR